MQLWQIKVNKENGRSDSVHFVHFSKYGAHHEPRTMLFIFIWFRTTFRWLRRFCELELEGSGGCSDVAGCSAEEELAGCSVDGASEEEGALSEPELDELSASFVEEDSTVLLDSGCGAEEVVLGKTCTFGTS